MARHDESSEGARNQAESGATVRIPIRDRRKLREDDGENVQKVGEALATGGAPAGSPGAANPAQGAPAEAKPREGPSLEEQLAKAKEEAAGYLDDLQRIQAEFDNYRKRTVREQTRLTEIGSLALIAQLLGVLDNFDLAVAAAEETKDFDRMVKGVKMVYDQFKEVLATSGLERIEAEGRRFDPRLHEAALESPGDGSGVSVVSDVLRNGYQFKGRVLRPAMVKVTEDASAAQQTEKTSE